MIHVDKVNDLQNVYGEKFAMVKSRGMIFQNISLQVWIAKSYFTINEITDILKCTPHFVRYHVKKNQWKSQPLRLTLPQVKQLIRIKNNS